MEKRTRSAGTKLTEGEYERLERAAGATIRGDAALGSRGSGGVPHHVTQRGNNRQQVFFSDQQRRLYLATLAGYATRNQLQILGYCLMPNHIHAVVVPQLQTSMGHSFGRAHSAYSRYFNRTRNRSGHLWQNRFYSAPLDRPRLLAALRYVDLNPVRARMTDHAESYGWSSATAHLTGRDPFGLIDPAVWEALCPAGGWKDMLQPARGSDEEWAQRLRAATHSGKPLGSQGLIEQMDRLAGYFLVWRRDLEISRDWVELVSGKLAGRL